MPLAWKTPNGSPGSPRSTKIAGRRTVAMKAVLLFLFMMLAFSTTLETMASGPDAPPDRQIAITIDDLPAAAANSMSTAAITEMTAKLLSTLRQQQIPVVGFVNEGEL